MRVTRPGSIVSDAGTALPGGRSESSSSQSRDSVTLSAVGTFATQLRDIAAGRGEIREDLVARAKADIANGTLGTPEDLDRAVEGLLRSL
jgi:anti-sigma28 factor (negative regulator of flagellin synthesis)